MPVERHLLVVLAHPDDESFACGGTIALHAQAGTPVTYVCATLGEMGRRMGRPLFANRETLRGLRRQELQAACAALGIGDLRLLGIWDKTVEFTDPAVLAAQVQAVMTEVRPTLVITFHPVHGGHQDHCAIGAATIQAVAGLPADQRPRVLCPAHPMLRQRVDHPTTSYDVGGVRPAKEAAIAAHRSQSEGMAELFARDPAAQQRWRQRFQQEQFWVYPV